ncbi:hypothetical protein FQA39_LY13828 [Lamprigera yunnana]|nr:hypothetical protein FQA39_LY13828 [Lamprigera yunnana]
MMDTKTQIEKCVKDYLVDEALVNYKIDVYSDLCKGSNFLGEVVKVHVTYTNKYKENIEHNLVAKVAKRNKKFVQLPLFKGLFQRELFLYITVLPQFLKIQLDKHITNPLRCYPQVYCFTNEAYNETLILEDMCAMGFKTCDRTSTLDYNHALLVIKELGRLHALSFAVRDQYNCIFNDYFENLQDSDFYNSTGIEIAFQEWFPKCIDVLDPVKDKQAFDKLMQYQNTFYSRLQKALRSEVAEPYAVIGHGDFWISNFLFKYNDLSIPSEVCMVDFQLAKFYSPACDISQLLFVCLDKKVRNLHYYDLVDAYYKSLCSFLLELGSDPAKLFPYHVLKEHLRKFSVVGLSAAVRMVYLISIPSSEIPDISLANSGLEAIQMVLKTKQNEKYYNERMGDVLRDFFKYENEL